MTESFWGVQCNTVCSLCISSHFSEFVCMCVNECACECGIVLWSHFDYELCERQRLVIQSIGNVLCTNVKAF